jgi:ABC-type lipoprotein export system ATPase subunit
MEHLIELEQLSKRYAAGVPAALDGVRLQVHAGESVAVMGPSGSGKSTLLDLIAGLDRPTSGTVTVAGERIDQLSETGTAKFRRREIGIIFQLFNLLEDLTVKDNVMLPAELAGIRRGEAHAKTAELLAKLGSSATATHTRRDCRAESASGSRSPARWSTRRRCCLPMSRQARSTPRPGRRSGGCCWTSMRKARRSCS